MNYKVEQVARMSRRMARRRKLSLWVLAVFAKEFGFILLEISSHGVGVLWQEHARAACQGLQQLTLPSDLSIPWFELANRPVKGHLGILRDSKKGNFEEASPVFVWGNHHHAMRSLEHFGTIAMLTWTRHTWIVNGDRPPGCLWHLGWTLGAERPG